MNGDEVIIATVSAQLESFSGRRFNTGCMEVKLGVRGVTAESEGARGWSIPADLVNKVGEANS